MLFPESSLGERHVGTGEYEGMEFFHVNARTIVNKVPAASRMPFEYTINAYRGCSHACTYCFARPTHAYLGLGIGEDFERKIVVKVNAVERLRAELRSPKWQGDHIAMGTNTDPYQKAEGKYHLTQGIVRVLAEAGNPFSILTKSTLVLRDLALLAEAAARTKVSLALSIGTLDREVWRLTEPGTPPPDKRLEAVARLNEAGVRCGVLIAPVLPGLSDSDEQLRAVAEGLPRGGGGLGHAGRPPPAPRCARALPGLAARGPARPRGPARRALRAGLLPAAGRAAADLRGRAVRRAPYPPSLELAGVVRPRDSPRRAAGPCGGYRIARRRLAPRQRVEALKLRPSTEQLRLL